MLWLKSEDWQQLSEVSTYRRAWQGLENASFFPLGSHPYCTAKWRKSAAFFCKERIAVPRQILPPPYCFVRSLCTAACAPLAAESQKGFVNELCCKLGVKGPRFWFWSLPPPSPTCGLLSSWTPCVSDPGTWHRQELVMCDFWLPVITVNKTGSLWGSLAILWAVPESFKIMRVACISWQFTSFPWEWALQQSEYCRLPASHQCLQCSECMDRHHSFEAISRGTDEGLREASTPDSGQELGSICPAGWAGDTHFL